MGVIVSGNKKKLSKITWIFQRNDNFFHHLSIVCDSRRFSSLFFKKFWCSFILTGSNSKPLSRPIWLGYSGCRVAPSLISHRTYCGISTWAAVPRGIPCTSALQFSLLIYHSLFRVSRLAVSYWFSARKIVDTFNQGLSIYLPQIFRMSRLIFAFIIWVLRDSAGYDFLQQTKQK